MTPMLSLSEYKSLVAPHLESLSDREIQQLYDFDTTVASYAVKTWLAARRLASDPVINQDGRPNNGGHDTLAPPCK